MSFPVVHPRDVVRHAKFGLGTVREVNPPKRPGSIPTVLVDGWSIPHGVTRECERPGRGRLTRRDTHVNIDKVSVVRSAVRGF